MNYSFRKFNPDTDVLKPFDCGIADLNGFLLENSGDIPNATAYSQQLLATTYVVEDDDTHALVHSSIRPTGTEFQENCLTPSAAPPIRRSKSVALPSIGIVVPVG